MNRQVKPRDEYIAFPKARFAYAFPQQLPDAEAGRRIKAIVSAVLERKKGVDSIADDAIENEAAYYKQKHAAARAKWEKKHPGHPYPEDEDEADEGEDKPPSSGPHGKSDAPHGKSNALTNRQTNKQTNLPNPNTKEKGRRGKTQPARATLAQTERASASVMAKVSLAEKYLDNPKDGIRKCDADLLAAFMVSYCGDDKRELAYNTYEKALREHGEEPFRQVAETFIAEVESGENVRNRGAAFMSRLQKLFEERTE